MVRKDSAIQKEFNEIVKVKKQAQFEYATSLGNDTKALDIFKDFCFKGEFQDKSCTNAKVLAVRMSDQRGLVEILEYLGDNKALLAEYELMGYFEKAAPLYVDLVLKKSPTIEHYLKAILLYELALNFETRNKLILDLAQFITKTKTMPEEIVPLMHTMMQDADVLDAKALKMPWPDDRKITIAKELEAKGKGNRETRKILTSTKETTGSLWAKFHLQKIEALYKAQGKKTFYGQDPKDGLIVVYRP